MKSFQRVLGVGLASAAFLLIAATVDAGGPEPEDRERVLAHVCKDGLNRGASCNNDADCPSSTCEIDYLDSPKAFEGVLTITVDEHIVDWDNPESFLGIALTALLEVEKNGQKHLFTETYQNSMNDSTGEYCPPDSPSAFCPPKVPGWYEPITENDLGLLSNDPQLLGVFLFQRPESALAQGLRDLFRVTGTPTVAGIAKKLDSSLNPENSLGSVVRFKLKIRFVNQ